MHVSPHSVAGNTALGIGCAATLLAKHRVVTEKKVLNGRSQWFSHVR
jgi:hypothetical protein